MQGLFGILGPKPNGKPGNLSRARFQLDRQLPQLVYCAPAVSVPGEYLLPSRGHVRPLGGD